MESSVAREFYLKNGFIAIDKSDFGYSTMKIDNRSILTMVKKIPKEHS